MSLNSKKWQAKCSELQKTLDDVILIKEEFVEKVHRMDRKANKFIHLCMYDHSFKGYFYEARA